MMEIKCINMVSLRELLFHNVIFSRRSVSLIFSLTISNHNYVMILYLYLTLCYEKLLVHTTCN